MPQCFSNRLHKEKSRLVKRPRHRRLWAMLSRVSSPRKSRRFSEGEGMPNPIPRPRMPRWGDYRKATALEALYGYLYLDDRMDRLMELIKISLNELDIHL